jgi:hypothetical protein
VIVTLNLCDDDEEGDDSEDSVDSDVSDQDEILT